jgi:hypothetical protein
MLVNLTSVLYYQSNLPREMRHTIRRNTCSWKYISSMAWWVANHLGTVSSRVRHIYRVSHQIFVCSSVIAGRALSSARTTHSARIRKDPLPISRTRRLGTLHASQTMLPTVGSADTGRLALARSVAYRADSCPLLRLRQTTSSRRIQGRPLDGFGTGCLWTKRGMCLTGMMRPKRRRSVLARRHGCASVRGFQGCSHGPVSARSWSQGLTMWSSLVSRGTGCRHRRRRIWSQTIVC